MTTPPTLDELIAFMDDCAAFSSKLNGAPTDRSFVGTLACSYSKKREAIERAILANLEAQRDGGFGSGK